MNARSCLLLLATLAAVGGGHASPARTGVADCFTAADNRALRHEVIQQAPPPRPGARAYAYYPLTGAATMQLGSLDRGSAAYARYYFQWGNRSNAPIVMPGGRQIARKPNFQSGAGLPRHQRTPFTSIDRANGCTLAQTATVLGLSAEAAAFARGAGISLVNETRQADMGDLGPADTCVVANATLPRDGTGVLLDYELADGRTPAQTTAFLRAYAALVRKAGRKSILMIDPFDAPSQRYNGISEANAHEIVQMFDRTTIFLWSRNAHNSIPASYRAQKAMIERGGAFDGSRILINFELANTTLDDAAFVRDTIRGDRLAGVLLWRDHAVQGGACDLPVNRKLAIVALGGPKSGGFGPTSGVTEP